MNVSDLRTRGLEKEISLSAVRSSGPGGQNVNKVSSKVELRFNLGASALLDDNEKTVLSERLRNKINKEGELIISAQTDRSQLKNREIVLERFYVLLEKALAPRKKRIATKPTSASRKKRMEEKKALSEKKKSRKPDIF